MPDQPLPPSNTHSAGAARTSDATERRVREIRQRLVREGTLAVEMLEHALRALWTLDTAGAQAVRSSDDNVDDEEVAIEQECYELLALHRPFAHDFRAITFSLRVNADLERVADHATSIAKIVGRVVPLVPAGMSVPWPQALRELGQRVPTRCHDVLRAVLSEDVAAARSLIQSDEVIDNLERRVFDETRAMVAALGSDTKAVGLGMFVYRAGRELERVGDLMANVAEDVVYLATGEIIRHAKRRGTNAVVTKQA